MSSAVPWLGQEGALGPPLREVLDSLFAFVGVLDSRGVLIQANQAPLQAAGLKPADVMGLAFWDCYWWNYDPAIAARIRAAVDACAAGGTVRFDVDARMAGGRLMRIDFMMAPLRDGAGRITHLIPSAVDVSERFRAEQALRDSEARLRMALRAAGAACFDWHLTDDTLFWTPEMYELYGLSPAGQPTYERWASTVLAQDLAQVEQVIARARNGDGEDFHVEFRIRHPRRGERWIASLGGLERLPDGRPYRLSGLNLDITDRKEAEQHQRLLMAEVDHRAKNMLAVVQAMLRLTKAETIDDFRTVLEGRVAALSHAHTLLAESRWRGANLNRLLREELAPFGGPESARVGLEGPHVLMAPEAAQAMGLILHELATNAAKYGALSVPEGRLRVSWAVTGQGLDLTWRELDGPPVRPPGDASFGTIVIDSSVTRQLGGRITRDWTPTGLVCRIALPPDTLATHGGLPADGTAEKERADPVVPPDAPSVRRNLSVLVVEDMPLVAMELEQVLRDAGFEVVGPAPSLAEALALARSARLDAAVLDVNLGGEPVFPLAAELRRQGVPFLFCTGYDPGSLRETAFGDTPALRKPLHPPMLMASLDKLLNAPPG